LPPEEHAQLGLRTSAGVQAYLGCPEPFLTSWLAADLHDLFWRAAARSLCLELNAVWPAKADLV